MLAGEFAAGTTAFEGDVRKIDLRLVRLCAATLTFAPHGHVVHAGTDPFRGIGQAFAGFAGRLVGRKGKYLFFCELQGIFDLQVG